MSRTYAFWDSSVLISLCAAQPSTTHALSLYGQYRIVIWWATPIEMTSAFMRLLRDGTIDADAYHQMQRQADGYAKQWTMMSPSAGIAASARRMLEQYPLRAADALQLAAAMAWCGGNAKGRVFLSFDKRLRHAAAMAGFTLA